mgnify:CR=1 FL=1
MNELLFESVIEKEGDHIHCESLVDNHEFDIDIYPVINLQSLMLTLEQALV